MDGANAWREALAELPHGAEFRFVDEMTGLDPGRSGVACYRVRGDEAFLAGHFPGDPLMPGVILIEAIAQLGGVVAQSDPVHPKLRELRLGGVRAAKILGAVRPGETIELRAEVEGRMGGMVQISGEARTAAGVMASARIVLSGVVPNL